MAFVSKRDAQGMEIVDLPGADPRRPEDPRAIHYPSSIDSVGKHYTL